MRGRGPSGSLWAPCALLALRLLAPRTRSAPRAAKRRANTERGRSHDERESRRGAARGTSAGRGGGAVRLRPELTPVPKGPDAPELRARKQGRSRQPASGVSGRRRARLLRQRSAVRALRRCRRGRADAYARAAREFGGAGGVRATPLARERALAGARRASRGARGFDERAGRRGRGAHCGGVPRTRPRRRALGVRARRGVRTFAHRGRRWSRCQERAARARASARIPAARLCGGREWRPVARHLVRGRGDHWRCAVARGRGRSKRTAERAAAASALSEYSFEGKWPTRSSLPSPSPPTRRSDESVASLRAARAVRSRPRVRDAGFAERGLGG